MLILIKYMILKKVITSHKELHEMKSCVKLRALELYTELSLLSQTIGCRHVKFGLMTCIWLSKDLDKS